MPEEERKVKPELVLAGVAGVFGLGMLGYGIYVLTRPEAPPTPPPGLANLYGMVTDAKTGQPIPMVIVETAFAVTQTDSSGHYEFTNLEIGDYSIEFRKQGYYTVLKVVTLTEGNNKLDVKLEPVEVPGVATLQGQVLDAVTKEPITGVKIQVLDKVAYTNALGEYYIGDIPPYPEGTIAVFITKSGYFDEVRHAGLPEGEHILNVQLLSKTITGMPTDEEIDATKALARRGLNALDWNPCGDIHYTSEMTNLINQVLEPINTLQKRIMDERQRQYDECLANNNIAESLEQKAEIDHIGEVMGVITGLWLRYQKGVTAGIDSAGACYRPAPCPPGSGYAMCSWAGSGYYDAEHGFMGYIPDLLSEEQREIWYEWDYYWYSPDSKIISVKLYYANEGINNALMAIRERCYNEVAWITRKAAELDYAYWYCGYPLGY